MSFIVFFFPLCVCLWCQSIHALHPMLGLRPQGSPSGWATSALALLFCEAEAPPLEHSSYSFLLLVLAAIILCPCGLTLCYSQSVGQLIGSCCFSPTDCHLLGSCLLSSWDCRYTALKSLGADTKHPDQEASWRGKSLPHWHFHSTVYHWRKWEPELKQSRNWCRDSARAWEGRWGGGTCLRVCFLTESRTTSPRMIPYPMSWAQPYWSLVEKMRYSCISWRHFLS